MNYAVECLQHYAIHYEPPKAPYEIPKTLQKRVLMPFFFSGLQWVPGSRDQVKEWLTPDHRGWRQRSAGYAAAGSERDARGAAAAVLLDRHGVAPQAEVRQLAQLRGRLANGDLEGAMAQASFAFRVAGTPVVKPF